MLIPDKYRERYDNLARSHPWMREMRDETETIGDLDEGRRKEIEERNHLIAKARNSFSSLANCILGIDQMRKGCQRAAELMDAEMERMGIGRDGRTTNGIASETNAIPSDTPLVDKTPKGDVVEILRQAARGCYDNGKIIATENGRVMECLRKLMIESGEYAYAVGRGDASTMVHLAEMVERDYVRREAYEDLRDEFVWVNTFLHRVGKHCGTSDAPSLKAYVEKLEAERDEYKRLYEIQAHETACQSADYVAEQQLSIALEHERDEWKARYEKQAEVLDLQQELLNERDEWKAKAEGSGMTNIEWMYRNYDGFAGMAQWWAVWEGLCEDSVQAEDWLVAERMDDDSIAHSNTEDKLSETLSDLYGIFSDESAGVEVDTREKLEADVRNHIAISISHEKNESVLASVSQVLEWLDRQAAITRREVLCCPDERDEQIAVLEIELAKRDKGIDRLKRKRDELQKANAKCADAAKRLMKYKEYGCGVTKQYIFAALLNTAYGEIASMNNEEIADGILEILTGKEGENEHE